MSYYDEETRYNELVEQVEAKGGNIYDILEKGDYYTWEPGQPRASYGYSKANTKLEAWLENPPSDGGTVDTDTPDSGANDGVDDGNTGDVAGKTDNGDAPASTDTGNVDGSNWFDDDLYKRIVNKTYNGNQIFYNGDATTEVLTNIKAYIFDLIALIRGYEDLDDCLDGLMYPYNGAPRHEMDTSIYLGGVEAALETAQETAVETIKQIVDAICNYDATGDTAGLTDVLSKKRSGGGGGGDAPASAPTFDGDDDLLGDLDNLGDEAIDEFPLENQEPSFDENEKLIIPGANNDSTRRVSSGSDSSLSSVTDETLELDDSSDIASSLDSVGTSFFGTDGKFFVPFVSTTSIEKDKVNSAGVVGAGAVLAAASLAVGGKIYYDKKNESENNGDDTVGIDDESNDNMVDSNAKDDKNEDEKDNIDDEKNSKSIFKSSGVKFKESILGDGGDL